MLSLKKRMLILDEELSKYTPEELFNKLNESPAIGPTLIDFSKELDKSLNELKNNHQKNKV